MVIDKLEEMLNQKGIFLARADTFKDKLEGTLSRANEVHRAEVYRNNPKLAAAFARYTEELAKMKRWTYVSCWRIDENESLRSWQEYASTSEGVAIQTTYGRIADYTSYNFCAKVRYVDFEETWVMEGNTLHPFLHKHNEFGWEQEFRIIVQQFPERDVAFDQVDYYECDSENPHCGLVLPVDLATFVERIVVGPEASPKFQEQVLKLATGTGVAGKVQLSSLSQSCASYAPT